MIKVLYSQIAESPNNRAVAFSELLDDLLVLILTIRTSNHRDLKLFLGKSSFCRKFVTNAPRNAQLVSKHVGTLVTVN